ncbi:MAG: DEAD/DEAH box helicase, partial [Candidatus Sulfotelmatobacter sp.]
MSLGSQSESAGLAKPTQGGKNASLYQFFAPGGVLARTHPAYEFRRGQLQMAQAVEQALEEKRHLIVEAGTGTGKTLAYLLPVIRSGKRVIISTGTKNLQEQLFYKDIPFLENALFGACTGTDHVGTAASAVHSVHHPSRISVCYMKGRNNYLCRKKLYDLTSAPVLSGLEEIEQYRAIAAWEKTTSTGDRAELAELPEASHLWHKLDARTEACTGQKCSEFERCFITEMRRRGMESDIVIVNHHLFFADLAIKLQAEGAPDAGILPEAAAVIFDEAHELEDVAANYFGISVSNLRFDDLTRDVESSLQHNHIVSASLSGALGSLREKSQFFFSLLPPGDGRFAFESRREFLEENGDEFLALNQALTRLAGELEGLSQKPEEVFNLVRRTQEIQMHLSFAMESEDRNTVFWIERRGGRGNYGQRNNRERENREGHDFSGVDKTGSRKGALAREARGRQNVFLQATPIDVGPILRECLWSKLESAVL